VVDALYTGDLDPTAATTPADLAALLRTVHLRADSPSLRVLEARTRHGQTPLSKTVASEVLKGTRFPRKAVMVAFLKACGEHDDRLDTWRRAWDQIAVGTQRPGAGPPNLAYSAAAQAAAPRSDETPEGGIAEVGQLREEISRLNKDNKRLRLQIGAAGHPAAAPGSQSNDGTDSRPRSPEVRRRELGAQLRALRADDGMTIEQVAAHLFCSPGKVSRMENGFRSGTVRDVRDLCDLYRVSDAQRDNLMELARQSKQRGWWQEYEYGLPFATYIGLEADAASIRSYHCTVVPGLLQTADYARAVVIAAAGRTLSPEVIEQRIQVRLTRQRVLTQSDPPKFWAILDEAVLHRIVGEVAVMAAQLDRLIELSGLENVTIQVIPYGSGCHPGLGGAFDILDFAGTLPGVVYVEGLFGVIYVEKVPDVDRHRAAFELLRDVALDQESSNKLIMRIRRDLEHGP
jgi:transcriptional regulator with XRE-family HTH domain